MFQMSKLGFSLNSKIFLLKSFKALSISFALMGFAILGKKLIEFCITNFYGYQNFSTSIVSTVSGFILFLDLSSFVAIFSFTMKSIRDRFSIINEILMKNSENFCELSKLHMKLCEISSEFYKIFSSALDVFFAFVLMAATFSLYELFYAVRGDAKDPQQLALCLIILMWNFLLAFSILLIFDACEATKSESEETLKCLLMKFKEKFYDVRIFMFIQQLNHSKPTFSFGFYVVDWKFLSLVSFKV